MKISLNKKKLTDIAFIVPSLAGVSIFVLIPFIAPLFYECIGYAVCFLFKLHHDFSECGIQTGVFEYHQVHGDLHSDPDDFFIADRSVFECRHPGSQLSENGISGAHGDPGGFGCADLAAFVSSEWLFQRPSAYVWDAVTGLDGYRICLLDSCFQLRLEKSRLQCCSVDGGSDGYPGYPL